MAKRHGKSKDKDNSRGRRIRRAILGTSAVGAVTYAVAKHRAGKQDSKVADQVNRGVDTEARRASGS